jgi:DNA processing protein
MSGREFWFALASVDGVGPIRIRRLLNRFGAIEAVFDADLSEIARIPLFNPLLAARVLKARIRVAEFRRHIKWFKSRGIEILCLEDPDYPEQLRKISDAPAILCKKGSLSQASQQAVAIVGTTNPTELGILTTLELSTTLVQAGFTIVSGLTKGIDTSAHLGALSANGTTIGVLGCDLFSIYPSDNRELADRISENGALFSEHPFTTQSTPTNLVLRNRIVSGLSIGVIVVESGKGGGAIRAATFALEQNRLVFACNWQQHHHLSEGPDHLIQRGAYPISPDKLAEVVDVLSNPNRLEKIQSTNITGEQMELFS